MLEISNDRFPLTLIMARGSGCLQTGAGVLKVSSKEDFIKRNSGSMAHITSGRDKKGKDLYVGELDWLEDISMN